MSPRGLAPTIIVASLLSGLLIAASAVAPTAAAALPGPTVDSPSDGQSLDYNGDFSIHVEPVAGASGYLYGFFQNSRMVWENYANERRLSGTDYIISANTPAHAAIQPGPLQIWARALVDGAWTDATILNVTLTGSGTNGPSTQVAAPTQVGNSFCFGPSLNLTWQDGVDWDAFHVYDGNRLLKELAASDTQLQRSGPTYYYAVPPPITHARLGVSAVKSGVESAITYINGTVTC